MEYNNNPNGWLNPNIHTGSLFSQDQPIIEYCMGDGAALLEPQDYVEVRIGFKTEMRPQRLVLNVKGTLHLRRDISTEWGQELWEYSDEPLHFRYEYWQEYDEKNKWLGRVHWDVFVLDDNDEIVY